MAEPVSSSQPQVSAPVDEDELVRDARQGNLTAYDELVKRYQERKFQGRIELLHVALPDCGQQDHQFPETAEKPDAHKSEQH